MEKLRKFIPKRHYSLGLLCDLLWSDPDKDVQGWGDNDRGVSFTFGADIVSKFLARHDLDLICRAHQVTYKNWEFCFKTIRKNAGNYFGSCLCAAEIGCRRWL